MAIFHWVSLTNAIPSNGKFDLEKKKIREKKFVKKKLSTTISYRYFPGSRWPDLDINKWTLQTVECLHWRQLVVDNT